MPSIAIAPMMDVVSVDKTALGAAGEATAAIANSERATQRR